MKLVLDPVPAGGNCQGCDFLLRVDSHDLHLHAAPGTPDAAWLATIRQSNKELGERIESLDLSKNKNNYLLKKPTHILSIFET